MSTISSAFQTPLTIFPPNFEKLENAFKSNPEKAWIKLLKFKDSENKSLKVTLEGTVTTNGISINSWEDKKSFSIGFRFDDDDELLAIDNFLLLVKKFTGDEYDIKSPAKDEIIYLKLKSKDNSSFAPTKSNLKLSPKKPADSVYQGQTLKATCELSFYINFRDKTSGLILSPLDLIFDD